MQLGTIQVDYQLPKRFDLEYVDHKNSKQTPVIIQSSFGSIERFIAILLNIVKGISLWLAIQQLIIHL